MRILTFTDVELAKIASESPTFTEKIKTIAQKAVGTTPVFVVDNGEDLANAFLSTVVGKRGMQQCVTELREWAKQNGSHKYATLAGAKRKVESYLHDIKNEASE